MTALPSLFVSHGSPMIMLNPSPARRFLAGLGATLAEPKAVLSVTAHWTTATPSVSADPSPETVHDFYGFPDRLYELSYPAPGAPKVARRAADLLGEAGNEVEVATARGFDHGTWTPMKLAYPEARIPTAEMSVQPGRSATHHMALGRALAPLRDEGVLILASGAATHNVAEFMKSRSGAPAAWVTGFADWLHQAVGEWRIDDLLEFESRAPEALRNHPTPEHFLPFFVALGAAGPDGVGERIHDSIDGGILAMDAYKFTQGAG